MLVIYLEKYMSLKASVKEATCNRLYTAQVYLYDILEDGV